MTTNANRIQHVNKTRISAAARRKPSERGASRSQFETRARLEHVRVIIVSAFTQMQRDYGPQGWWPVFCERRSCTNADGVVEPDGYHVGQFDFPRTRQGRWEICCGAVLTQNTSWSNVRTALAGLRKGALVTPERILTAPKEILCDTIRPARYFNQKTNYVRAVAEWFIQSDRTLARAKHSRSVLEATRPELLKVLGVGRETADSILLYAYALPTFVIDAYTRRIFSQLGVLDETWGYEQIRALFETVLVQQTQEKTVEYWQEGHALIVEHARRLASRKYVSDK